MNINEEKTTQENTTSGINGSGIFRWDDPQEINKKLSNLTGQPVWEVNDDYYENTILITAGEPELLTDPEKSLV